MQPLEVKPSIHNSRIVGVYTRLGFEVVVLKGGTIVITPIAQVYYQDGLSPDVLKAALEDEREHISDFNCYLNGRYASELSLLLESKDKRLGINTDMYIQSRSVGRADDIADATRWYWDIPRGGNEKYHQINMKNGVFQSTSPQPAQSDIDAYRLRVFGSTNTQ